MRHYKALQRLDGKYDYTCNRVAVGYCTRYNPYRLLTENLTQFNNRIKFHDKYHIGGHDTVEEACNCYKQYLIDQCLRKSKMSNQMLKCKVCQEYTVHFVEVGCAIIVLCEHHLDRVHELFEVSESWES